MKTAKRLPHIPKLDLTKAPAYEDSESQSELYKVAQRENTKESDQTSQPYEWSSQSDSMLEFLLAEKQTLIASVTKPRDVTERSSQVAVSGSKGVLSPFERDLFSSAVKRERSNFLNAFKIEEVWAEMHRIKENKQKVDLVF